MLIRSTRPALPSCRTPVSLLPLATVLLLMACGGDSAPRGDSASTATPDNTDVATAGGTAGGTAGAGANNAAGEATYARCVVCHQANGQGMPGAFPPLAGSEWVTGSPSRVVAVITHGLQGPITVKGTEYNAAMMAWGNGAPMSAQEVADVATYIRSSWGNSASAVTAADVERIQKQIGSRSAPFTAAELQKLP